MLVEAAESPPKDAENCWGGLSYTKSKPNFWHAGSWTHLFI